jgi:hypothetical protein
LRPRAGRPRHERGLGEVLQLLASQSASPQLQNTAARSLGARVGPGDQQVADVDPEQEIVALHRDKAGRQRKRPSARKEITDRRFERRRDCEKPARRTAVFALLVFADLPDSEFKAFGQRLLRQATHNPSPPRPSRHIEIEKASRLES